MYRGKDVWAHGCTERWMVRRIDRLVDKWIADMDERMDG